MILLHAEDNLPDALLVREAIQMESLPVEIHVVSDGEQAIDFMTRAEEGDPAVPEPEFLLLDLNLPKIDGFEVLRKVRASEKYGSLPVLILTSSDSIADRREAERLGAGFFRKPIMYEEFLKIGRVLKNLMEANKLL